MSFRSRFAVGVVFATAFALPTLAAGASETPALASITPSALASMSAPLAPAAALAPDSKAKLHFQFHAFPETAAVGVDRTFMVCLLNEGGNKELENPNKKGETDQLQVFLPVGMLDFDLMDDASALACANAPAGWDCSVDTTDPGMAVVTMQPSGASVLVEAEETVCFDLENVRVNDEEGLVRVFLEQSIEKVADKPVNDFVKLYKNTKSLLSIEGGDNITITGPNNVIDVAPQGDASGLDADLLDGLEATEYDASQAELDAEEAARIAADAALQANIDAEETARIAADAALQANIDAEETARIAADAALAADIAAEEAARIAADAALAADIAAEEAARIADVDTEEAARLTADAALQAGIAAEEAARLAADATLAADIAAEEAARVAGDTHVGDVAGLNTDLQIQPNAVGSSEIIDGTIVASDVNSGSIQLRVGTSCPPGSSIRVIGSSGAVTCEVDDNTSGDNDWSFNGSSIFRYGNVGINDSTPSTPLVVAGTITAGSMLDYQDTSFYCNPSASSRYKGYHALAYDSGWVDIASDQGNPAETTCNTCRVPPLIGPYVTDCFWCGSTTTVRVNVEVNGGVRAYGFFETSDGTLKQSVATIPNALDKVLQMRGVTYDPKGDVLNEYDEGVMRSTTGFIAQELQQALPQAVQALAERDENGELTDETTLAVRYTGVIPVLVEAMKEQQAIIDALEARLAELEGGSQ